MILIGSFTILRHGNIAGFLSGFFFTILKHGNIGSDHEWAFLGS